MPLKYYVFLMLFGTLLCWCAWALVLWKIDPATSGMIGLMSFFLSLFLALLGTFTLLGFAFRRSIRKDTIAFRHIGISVRQGLFFSLVLVGSLLLRSTGLYVWWSMLFLLAGFTLLEFFFLTHEHSA